MAKTPRYVESKNVGVSSLFLRPNGAASLSYRSSASLAAGVVVSGEDGATFADLKLIASFKDLYWAYCAHPSHCLSFR
jgi:hypothetical protein